MIHGRQNIKIDGLVNTLKFVRKIKKGGFMSSCDIFVPFQPNFNFLDGISQKSPA